MKTKKGAQILWIISLLIAVCLFTFPVDVLYGADEPVNVPDKALKAAVERTLGVANPTPADMLQLTALSAPRSGISDLTGLEYAVNLRILDLHLNRITSVSPPLAALVNLEELDLGGNRLTDIRLLSNLVGLRKLDLHGGGWLGTGILDISALAQLSRLESLDLGSNRIGVIGDLSPLAGLTKLQKLELWSNQITDVNALAGLTNLSDLELWNNQISNISVLSRLVNLEKLHLAGNRIADLCPLGALSKLELLDVVGNPLDVGAWDLCVPQILALNPGMELSSDLNPEENLLVNGGFEQGPEDPNPTGGFTHLYRGSMDIPGWRVTRGSIDYQRGYWEAVDGTRSIDLYGSGAMNGEGGIGQTFPTTPGHVYEVTFWLSGNPEGPVGEDPVKWLSVQAAGQTALFSFDCTNYTKSNMGWRQTSWVFAAGETATTIEFFSRYQRSGGAYYGPALDRVSVREVPGSSLPLPTTLYVDDDAAGDSGPGDPHVSDPNEDGSAAHPYDAIQEAIDAANLGDAIVVLDGTYMGTGNHAIHFKGMSTALRSQNGPSNCIIDCQGQGRAFSFRAYEDSATVLQGLTIRNGDVSSETERFIRGSGVGGAIYCEMGSKPTIRDCVFDSNRANYGGGAIYYELDAGPLSLVECTFINNSAVGVGADGGAVRSLSATLTAHRCTFRGNSATWNGGAVSGYGSVVLSNCEFAGNSARSGGGLSCAGNLTLTNCVFAGNSAAQSGGAVYALFFSGRQQDAPPSRQIEMRSCTSAANSAVSGRSFACVDLHTQVHVDNCILWNGGSEIDSRATLNVTCSDVQGGFKGEGNIALDPAFVNPSLGDYHLSPTSPCINLGNPNYAPAADEFDIDGQPRVVGGRVDMGADEYLP